MFFHSSINFFYFFINNFARANNWTVWILQIKFFYLLFLLFYIQKRSIIMVI